MTTIHVKTIDQVLCATIFPKIAPNNYNSVRLEVDFDEAWDGYGKSALFYTSKNSTMYERILSADNICLIPPEVLLDSGHLFISIKGAKVNEIKRSTELRIKISDGMPLLVMSEPSDDVYKQLLAKYGSVGALAAIAAAEVEVLRNQLANLIALENGSTTGDAELINIREGADGESYATAGDAVRGQYGKARWLLDSVMNTEENNLFDPLTCSNGTALVTADGSTMSNADYWCTDYFSVAGTRVISFNLRPYKIVWYTEEKALVAAHVAGDYGEKFADVPAGAYYARAQYANANVAYIDRAFIVVCNSEQSISDVLAKYTINPDYVEGFGVLGVFSEDENNLLNPLKCLNNVAFETATGKMFTNASYWVTDYIPAKGVSDIASNKTIYKYAWYDEDKNFLQKDGTAPSGAAYLVVQFSQSVVPFSDRFNVIVCDSSIDIIGVNPHYYIKGDEVKSRAINAIGEYKFSIPLTGTSYMSDHTFINGQLFVINASSDDHSTYAGVTVYDVDIENKTSQYVRTFNHNLGHANTIDYCAANGCLILGNGSSDASLAGEIYILPDAANKATWEYNDCIKIDLSSEGWGIKTNVVWGEHNNGNYNIAYVITNNNANVRKILLTKTDGQFDGGYVLLDEWQTESVDVNQGSVYRNGKLYIAIGHSQVWLLEYTLNADGTISKRERKDIFYDESGNVLTTPFAEGVTIQDNYILFGASSGDVLVYEATMADGGTQTMKGDKGNKGDKGDTGDYSPLIVTGTFPATTSTTNGTTQAPVGTMSHTWDEICEAFNAGRDVRIRFTNNNTSYTFGDWGAMYVELSVSNAQANIPIAGYYTIYASGTCFCKNSAGIPETTPMHINANMSTNPMLCTPAKS